MDEDGYKRPSPLLYYLSYLKVFLRKGKEEHEKKKGNLAEKREKKIFAKGFSTIFLELVCHLGGIQAS